MASTNPYLAEVLELKKTIPTWDTMFNDKYNISAKEEKEPASKKQKKAKKEPSPYPQDHPLYQLSPQEIEAMKERDETWVRLEVIGQALCDKYSWAIPDARSLAILQHFSPLVEIGSGKGYWASLLRKYGTDINAYDAYVFGKGDVACSTGCSSSSSSSSSKKESKKEEKKDKKKNKGKKGEKDEKEETAADSVTGAWTNVKKGGPEQLSEPENEKRNLFLCYPDEAESMAAECLVSLR
jgi:hypothetical protein